MIVDDQHGFIFIHIPKCGGSSVRRALAGHDSTGGFFTARVAPLGALGMVDHVHLPLAVLRAHFPDQFAKLSAYRSFALMRDPETRFGSALGQWFRNTRHERILETGAAEIAGAAAGVLGRLEDDPASLAPEMIHFRPQADFIELDGTRLVQRLYRVEEIGRAWPGLARYLGIDTGAPARENQVMYYRNRLVRTFVTGMKPALLPLWRGLPLAVKQRLHRALLRPPQDAAPPTVRGTGLTVAEVLAGAGLMPRIAALYARDRALLADCERVGEEVDG